MFAARQGFFSPQGGPPINVITDGLSSYVNAGFSNSYPGSGTTWNDISGNGRNFVWASTPTTGVDGTVPYFVTLNNLANGPACNSFGINNTSGYTITIVCRQVTLTQAAGFAFTRANTTGTASRGIFTHLAWIDNNIYFDQGGCCAASQRTSAGSGGTNAWNVWTFRRLTNSSTRTIFKNATTLANNTAAASTLDLDARAASLGGAFVEYGSNSSPWNAYLYAFVVYSRGLSDAEVIANSNSIRSTLGI
jgi:hypothetical protein